MTTTRQPTNRQIFDEIRILSNEDNAATAPTPNAPAPAGSTPAAAPVADAPDARHPSPGYAPAPGAAPTSTPDYLTAMMMRNPGVQAAMLAALQGSQKAPTALDRAKAIGGKVVKGVLIISVFGTIAGATMVGKPMWAQYQDTREALNEGVTQPANIEDSLDELDRQMPELPPLEDRVEAEEEDPIEEGIDGEVAPRLDEPPADVWDDWSEGAVPFPDAPNSDPFDGDDAFGDSADMPGMDMPDPFGDFGDMPSAP